MHSGQHTPSTHSQYTPGASFTKEVNLGLAKRPLVFNGRLANRGLTSLVKEATDTCQSHSYICTHTPMHTRFNTLRPKWKGYHLADNVFKCILFNENIRTCIFIQISSKIVPEGTIVNKSALVQMPKRWQAKILNHCWPRCLMPCGIPIGRNDLN